MKEWIPYLIIIRIKATGKYIEFDSHEECDEYIKEHNLSKDEYDIPFFPRELPPLIPEEK